jgi:hypothetical protein
MLLLKQKLIQVDLERRCKTPAGEAGKVRLMQAFTPFTPRRLTARPAESKQLSLQSTTPHYLVNSNKVWRVSYF